MGHAVGELGLDYAWSHPGVDTMWNAGYRFAMRYLSWLPNGKVIGKSEYSQLLAKGIAVGMNWEYSANDQRAGASGGHKDATEAKRQMKALGVPLGKVCYFSADWDVASNELGTCLAYWKAARAVMAPEYGVGVYSGYRTIKFALDNGFHGWQTYAWSGGAWDPRAHIRQIQNGIRVGGADCDKNQLMRLDAGLVGLGAPTPTPVPVPAASRARAYRFVD